MKPIEFMDALSDIKEDYIREMLGEADAPAASAPIAGAVTQKSAIAETKTERITEGIRTSGKEKTFGGKMRYIVLFASAAACVAFAVGMLHLHHGSEQDSLIADSILSDITEITETTTRTETTTETTTQTAGTTVSSKPKSQESTAETTEASRKTEKTDATTEKQSGGAQNTTQKTTTNTTAQTTAKTSDTKKTTTTTTTTVTTEDTAPVTTTSATPTTIPSRKHITQYTQPYMLGDIDLDGDITLVDYFIARRNWTRWHENEAECEINYAAFDRGNVDRIIGDCNDESPISLTDVCAIKDIALSRKWLGRPTMTVPDYLETVDIYNTVFYTDDDLVAKFNSLYEFDAGGGYSGDVMIGELVPKEVCDFYNDAHTLEHYESRYPTYDYRFCWWSQDEFNQKMNELRIILARN